MGVLSNKVFFTKRSFAWSIWTGPCQQRYVISYLFQNTSNKCHNNATQSNHKFCRNIFCPFLYLERPYRICTFKIMGSLTNCCHIRTVAWNMHIYNFPWDLHEQFLYFLQKIELFTKMFLYLFSTKSLLRLKFQLRHSFPTF